MAFRDRLFATLRAMRPLFAEPGLLIVGSEVPNLLQPGVASTLVVSQDVDVGVPVTSHAGVKRLVGEISEFESSADEPPHLGRDAFATESPRGLAIRLPSSPPR